MTSCPTIFCGCQAVNSFYDPQPSNPAQLSILLGIIYILIVSMVMIKMSLSWFIYKDYYPLKQRSPILCMLLIVTIGIHLLLYPTIYVINFLTMNFTNRYIKLTYRTIHTALQFTPFLIYLVRSMRIVYAHQCQSSQRRRLSFRIFKNQAFLAVVVVMGSILRALPVIVDNFKDSDSHFMLIVEYSGPQVGRTEENLYLYHYFVSSFIWKLILVYCIYLQRLVHSRYSMEFQLIFVFFTEFFSFLLLISVAMGKDSQNYGVLKAMCYSIQIYPLSEIVKAIRLWLLLGISILFPLRKRMLYHKLLPTGRIFGFVKTMRDFLMEKQFLLIYSQFMKFLDHECKTKYYTSLLEFWKQMIIIRYKQQQYETQKITKIKQLIAQYQDLLFQDSKKFITTLKLSILSLQSSLNQHNDSSILDPAKNTNDNFSSFGINSKHRQQINAKVDELEKITLTKLDKVYVDEYIKTKSYTYLKRITSNNKKINLNLIMLNMALIVDSVHQQQ